MELEYFTFVEDKEAGGLRQMATCDFCVDTGNGEKTIKQYEKGGLFVGTSYADKEQKCWVSRSSIVSNASEIRGDVFVGENCTIISSSISGHSIIRDKSEILNSTIEDSTIDNSKINESLVCGNCEIKNNSYLHSTNINKSTVDTSSILLSSIREANIVASKVISSGIRFSCINNATVEQYEFLMSEIRDSKATKPSGANGGRVHNSKILDNTVLNGNRIIIRDSLVSTNIEVGGNVVLERCNIVCGDKKEKIKIAFTKNWAETKILFIEAEISSYEDFFIFEVGNNVLLPVYKTKNKKSFCCSLDGVKNSEVNILEIKNLFLEREYCDTFLPKGLFDRIRKENSWTGYFLSLTDEESLEEFISKPIEIVQQEAGVIFDETEYDSLFYLTFLSMIEFSSKALRIRAAAIDNWNKYTPYSGSSKTFARIIDKVDNVDFQISIKDKKIIFPPLFFAKDELIKILKKKFENKKLNNVLAKSIAI